MNNDNSRPSVDEALRTKAIERLDQDAPLMTETVTQPSLEEVQRTNYELRVHQIELEMQNEELRRIQTQLELAKSRYFDLYDLAPIGYCTLSHTGTIDETNLTLADLLGETRSQLLNRPLFRFISIQDQDIYYLHRQKLAETGQPQSSELRMVRKDGSIIWARIDSSLPFGMDETPVCRMMIADISEVRRLAEEKRLMESRIGQFQRLESLGALAAGVAHNLNNVLASVMGASSLRESLAKDPADIEAFGIISTACQRGRDVVRSLLQFARPTLVRQGPFELHALISELRLILLSTTSNRIRIVEEFCRDPLWAMGEAGNLSGAIMNLCINSICAMPDGGTLRLRTHSISSDWMEITIQDTGEGMSPETVARAFEPFFTTKPQGKGTGLGLSMTHGVVTAHGGTIAIESRIGDGTLVKIRLPRIASVQPESNAVPIPNSGVSLDVLVVDDDKDIRIVDARMLEAMGHKSMSVSNGKEAVKFLRGPHRIDLVILDQNMPGMDGLETLTEIRLLHPDLPILVSSGQLDIEALANFQLPGVAVISKPFGMKELKEKIEPFLRAKDAPDRN